MWKCGKLNASKEDDDDIEDTFSEDKAEAIITHSSVASSPPLRRPRVLISLDAKRVRRALFMAAQTKMDRRLRVLFRVFSQLATQALLKPGDAFRHDTYGRAVPSV